MAEGGTSRLKNDTDENMDISNDMFMPPAENVTVLNLSGKYQDIEDLPPYLTHLNISHNNLKKVPQAVLQLRHLVHLDISFNKIEEFDDKPYFCDTIEQLDMSKNALIRPPYWIWSQAPAKLYYLKMFGNPFYERCFRSGQFERLLTYRTKITDLDLSNCCLRRKGLQLLITFPNVKNVTLGINDYSYLNRNHLLSLPCQGLDTFFGVERLIVCNTCISTVNSNITMFKHLIEIDLSENRLRDIPKEFSLLKNLEICDLSYNKLLYLPDNMNMMVRLRVLLLVGNDLCMVPANLAEIESLTTLDLYDNNIYEVSERLVERVAEIDLAQNYFDEPQTEAYMEKKQRLRLNKEFREDGRKVEVMNPEYSSSSSTTDESASMQLVPPNNAMQESDSSSENWDTDDDHWVPDLNWRVVLPLVQQQEAALHEEDVNAGPFQMYEAQFEDHIDLD